MMSWKVRVLIIGILVFAAYMLFMQMRRQRQNKVQIQQIQSRCSGNIATDSIFVCISSDRDNNAGRLLYDLFDSAYCPFRVFVGINEVKSAGRPSAATVYSRLSKRGPRSFVDQIRYSTQRRSSDG